jgi:NAD(P)-dependent dehydrogenase (short-subunit alcohol dehydrogenase family)
VTESSAAAEEARAQRTAVVTGAASGIGNAVARRLVADGAAVVAVDLDRAGLESVEGASAYVCDLRDPSERARLVEDVGAVEYLVNAAGIIRLAPLDEVEPEDWDAVMDVNAKSVFFLTQALGRRMREGAAVVNVASTAGKTASTVEAAVYNFSKAAVIAITKTFAHAWASRSVRVNCVCPGPTETPMIETVVSDVGRARAIDPEEVRAAYHRAIPLGRSARPQEVAAVIRFLLSNEASYMTGQAVNVSGGLVMY